jgi:phage N-6-adenine-methyltransferase
MTNTADGLGAFTSQETDEWATPPSFVRPLAAALDGFDLDPCSGAENSPVASETFTAAEDGLAQAWFGDVWVNPPYSEMEAWTRKAINEANRSATARVVMLCKGDSSTDWWQSAVRQASAVAMLDRRLSFGDGEAGAPFPSHVLVFGDPPDELLSVLGGQGTVFTGRYERATQETLA